MAIINGVETVSRQRVYTDNFDEQKAFAKAVFSTSVGKRFKEEFANSDENIQAVLDAVARIFPGEPITESHFLTALELTMNAGDLVRKPAAPAPAVEAPAAVPTDKNGRPLTEAQQRWSEYRQFSETHNMDEVRARKRIDAGYRNFVEKNSERERISEGAFKVLNGVHELPQSDTPADLAAWVAEYQRTSVDQIKKLRLASTNPLGYVKYNAMFELAASKNLI